MRQQTLLRRGAARQRGMAMALILVVLLTLLAMAILGVLAGSSSSPGNGSGSAAQVSDASVRFSADVVRSVSALALADAGVEDTILWLTAQSAPPSNTTAFAPSASTFTIPLWNATTQTGPPPRAVVQYPDANDTFSVTIYPASGNAGNSQKCFLVESIGNYQGFKRVVHTYLQQASFGHYAFFEDGAGGGSWDGSYITFDGPVHMNNESGTHPMTLNWDDGGSPIFTYNGPDAYTVGFSLGYSHNWQSVSGPPASTDSTGWSELSVGGPGSIKDGQNNISMPTSAEQQSTQKTAALGTLTIAPTLTVGATACPNGGIYIHGDVQQMTLSVSPTNSATQIIELYQIDPTTSAKDYTKITLDATANQTTIQTGTYSSSGAITLNALQPLPSAGLTNGVVYCDGNIGKTATTPAGGIKGVIADNTVNSGGSITHYNSLTIATDPTKNTSIDGPIVDNTPRQIQQNSSGKYEFMNYNDQMVTSSSKTTPANCVPLYVATAADTGNFGTYAGRLGLVSDYNVVAQNTYDSTGTTSTGNNSSVEVDAALFSYGTLDSNVTTGLSMLIMGGDVHSGPEQSSGSSYRKFSYDSRLSDLPPPYFPTTNNRYTVLSWQTANQTVEGSP